MKEKVKVTEVQAKALQLFRNEGGTVKQFVKFNHIWTNDFSPLKNISVEQMKIGFEVGFEIDENEIEHDKTGEIVCPYCGYFNSDEKALLEFEKEIDCQECNNKFGYSMTITYDTWKTK